MTASRIDIVHLVALQHGLREGDLKARFGRRLARVPEPHPHATLRGRFDDRLELVADSIEDANGCSGAESQHAGQMLRFFVGQGDQVTGGLRLWRKEAGVHEILGSFGHGRAVIERCCIPFRARSSTEESISSCRPQSSSAVASHRAPAYLLPGVRRRAIDPDESRLRRDLTFAPTSVGVAPTSPLHRTDAGTDFAPTSEGDRTLLYSPSPSMFFRGQTIGKYRILSSLGSGGFGVVYLAEDTWIDKKVALKVPHKQNLDFSRDAQGAAAARLHEPSEHRHGAHRREDRTMCSSS